jgi:acetylornithine deacetylase/succinyl-diaminopimelate desuccinylase-like protein
MGLMGVPTIGFGPGEEDVAHSVVERVPIRHLVEAAEFYAAFPLTYVDTMGNTGQDCLTLLRRSLGVV